MTGLPAARLGDIGSGHAGDYSPSPAVEGSANVYINGRSAVRKGDKYAPHSPEGCAQPLHPRSLSEGASTVFFNGCPAGRISDAIDCGGHHMTGSPNVFIGNVNPEGSRLPFREKCPYSRD